MSIAAPEPVLGVVGGGQLGRMLGEAAPSLGVDVVVSDPTPAAPASPVVRDQIVGEFDDRETLRELAERADWLTYEIELADPEILAAVGEATDTPVHPAPDTLERIQDKLVQFRTFADAGVPVPAFRAVDSVDACRDALAELGAPAMLKARTGGYDGRGNVPVESAADVPDAMAELQGPAILQEFVDFERELAVIGCRGRGERAVYPVTETVHEAEILRQTVSPARAPETVRERARSVARDVLDVVGGRGVFGIELFETADGEVQLNEVAPRPHNSGHWTIEGCHTSQFEQHVRAVTGRPLGDTGRRSPTATANVLGDVSDPGPGTMRGADAVFEADRAHLHWYGKRDVYDLRKMGHLTVVGEGDAPPGDPLVRAAALASELTFRPE